MTSRRAPGTALVRRLAVLRASFAKHPGSRRRFGASRRGRNLCCGALVVLLVLPCFLAGPVRAQEPVTGTDWRALLDRAVKAARTTSFTGEAIWITWFHGQTRVVRSAVRSNAVGGLVLSPDEGPTVRIGHDGAGLVDRDGIWLLTLPIQDPDEKGLALTALEAKYQVITVPPDRIMNRPCARLDIRRRSDGSLRERLWIDAETGLLLRRDTYGGGAAPVRLAAYLSLDLNPGVDQVGTAASAETRRQRISEVDPAGLEALREAGWAIPEKLPGGYEHAGVYTLSLGDGQPLQATYSDGLYAVSTFQQPGRLDWGSLPPGAERVEELGWPAYHWPGAVPARLVWEAADRTFLLVGDAPDDEFHAIARALPHPQRLALAQRLGRGLRRLWTWLSDLL